MNLLTQEGFHCLGYIDHNNTRKSMIFEKPDEMWNEAEDEHEKGRDKNIINTVVNILTQLNYSL